VSETSYECYPESSGIELFESPENPGEYHEFAIPSRELPQPLVTHRFKNELGASVVGHDDGHWGVLSMFECLEVKVFYST
jgi:hypothetical protein